MEHPSVVPVSMMEHDNDNDRQEDDMADLFSFSFEGSPAAATSGNAAAHDRSSSSLSPAAAAAAATTSPRDRMSSEDSLLEMIAASEITTTTPSSSTTTTTRALSSESHTDQETQDILDWLNGGDSGGGGGGGETVSSPTPPPGAAVLSQPSHHQIMETPAQQQQQQTTTTTTTTTAAATSLSSPPTNDTTTPTTESQPTPLQPAATIVALPPMFTSFDQALYAPQSTARQIRDLYAAHIQPPQQQRLLSPADRQQLYCRMVTGKSSVADTAACSLADAFCQFRATTSDLSLLSFSESAWLPQQASIWSKRVAQTTSKPVEDCQADLTKLLLYYFKNSTTTTSSSSASAATTSPTPSPEEQPKQNDSNRNNSHATTDHEQPTDSTSTTTSHTTTATTTPAVVLVVDPLVPPVAATILATGMPVAAASVVLSQLVPTYMPLLALQASERWEAALVLHTDLYRLACYHLPFLVYHLDRYLPGWHWPRIIPASNDNDDATHNDSATVLGRNLEKQGQLPPSWLLTHWAGECSDNDSNNSSFSMTRVLELWDRILTQPRQQKSDMRFFLALAVLQEAADELLLLTGDDLLHQFQSVIRCSSVNNSSSTTTMDDDDGSDDAKRTSVVEINVADWWARAQLLQSCTPESVHTKLQSSEDVAIQQALERRHERAEAALQARLEAQAAAHQAAQEKKADEARDRLTRARLVAFYRKVAPDKETNVDILMEKYAGRYEVLDAMVKKKYGEGFNPAVKPKPPGSMPPRGANKLLATMNQSIGGGRRKSQLAAAAAAAHDDDDDDKNRKTGQVAVTVTPAEVLPVICWSREAAAARGVARRHRHTSRKPLKFYLVDSRSEEAAHDQGKFPTAASLSPEALLDPERIRQNEDTFESLRGAVHIVVMGEGFSALSTLYSQKFLPNLDELIREDDSRTNICALFFIKKGFPFVSVLEGGFAAAHSWLVREGEKHHLSASSVLVDYDPEASLFGQMETYQNASAKEKAQRAMQKLLENSLVTMTRSAQQLERLTAEKETRLQGGLQFNIFRRGGGKLEEEKVDAVDEAKPEQKGASSTNHGEQGEKSFLNPFAGLGKQLKVATTTAAEADEGRKDTEEKKSAIAATADHAAESTATPTSAQAENSMLMNPLAAIRRSLSGDDSDPEHVNKKDKAQTETADADDGVLPPPLASPNRFASAFKGIGVTLNSTIMSSTLEGDAKTTSTEHEATEQSAAPTEPSKPMSNPFKGIGAALNSTIKATTTAAATPPSDNNVTTTLNETKPTSSVTNVLKRNPFGAALNSTIKATTTAAAPPSDTNVTTTLMTDTKPASSSVTNVLKRNPFARFGGGNKQQPQQPKSEKAPLSSNVVGFAGLNQLRKSTMARMRSTGTPGETDAETEEEVAFGGGDDDGGGNLNLDLGIPSPEGPPPFVVADVKPV